MYINNACAGGLDKVTVLVCKPGYTASKKIVAKHGSSPEVKGFNAGALFAVMRKPVSNIHELSHLLVALERMPNVLVIRGNPASSLNLRAAVRRLKKNFATPLQGRWWILIDFDKIPLPPGLSVTRNAKVVAGHLVSLLPEEFHDASYHYQLSSSAGLKDPDVASMHVWFWLAQPWPDKELKNWAKAVNAQARHRLVDPALFNDVQPHYVAAPVFEGMEDPFPTRSQLVIKGRNDVELRPIDQPKDGPKTGAPTGSAERSPGFEAILAQIGDHPGGEGFHEPIIRAVASYISTHGRADTDVEWLFETVRKRVLEADRSNHDDGYVEHMASREHIMSAIEGALEKFGDADPRRKSRVVPGMPSHYSDEPGGDAQLAQSRLDQALVSIVKVVPWRSK